MIEQETSIQVVDLQKKAPKCVLTATFYSSCADTMNNTLKYIGSSPTVSTEVLHSNIHEIIY